jgi:signal transduction histidine kinase
MTVITGHCGLLEMESDLPCDVRQSIQHMATAAQSLSRYVDEATIIAKAPRLKSEVVSLQEVLEKSDLVKVVEIPGTRIMINADRRRLQEILEQICRNASEAGARHVHLVINEDVEPVELKFRDDGPGMKPPVLSRAFDPFYTTKKSTKNFGLGLFKARGMLAKMSGEIAITSDGRSYTEVSIRLPRAEGLQLA